MRGALVVRWGETGEKVELLNGQTVEVDPSVGVIADAAGVEALAGVMGGEATSVTDDTRNIYIEAAFWWPQAIAGRARRFNFSTDASHRFERGVDFASTVEHLEHITRLVLEICGGEPGPVDDTVKALPERKAVRMRVARAQRVIGVAVPADEMADIFRRLALPCAVDGDAFRFVRVHSASLFVSLGPAPSGAFSNGPSTHVRRGQMRCLGHQHMHEWLLAYRG